MPVRFSSGFLRSKTCFRVDLTIMARGFPLNLVDPNLAGMTITAVSELLLVLCDMGLPLPPKDQSTSEPLAKIGTGATFNADDAMISWQEPQEPPTLAAKANFWRQLGAKSDCTKKSKTCLACIHDQPARYGL